MNESTIYANYFENAPDYTPEVTRAHETVAGKKPVSFYSDAAIILGLKARNVIVINYVYRQSYPQIRYLVISNSGTRMDAEDLFQDAMVVMYQKICADSLVLTSSFKTYLYSICRHLWLQKLNKHQFNFEYRDISDLDDFHDKQDNDELLDDNEKYRLFQQHFLRLNTNDQKVLKLYLAKTSLREMARIMGYKSENYAKFRKYICKEKLKNAILADPEFQKIYQQEIIPVIDS